MKELIILTGLPRTGSTWVANTIGKSPSLNYLSGEPLNPPFSGSSFGLHPECWNQYIDPSLNPAFYENLQNAFCLKWAWRDTRRRLKYLANHNTPDPILYLRILKHYFFYVNRKINFVKDPALFFSAENLYRDLNCKVIIIHRHPAAFVSSMMRVHWDFDFNVLLKQENLVKDYLAPMVNEMKRVSYGKETDKYLDRLVLLWRIYNRQIYLWEKKYAGNWIFLKHEDISQNPYEGFNNIFKQLKIILPPNLGHLFNKKNLDQRAEARTAHIHDFERNSRKIISLWKDRLSPGQINSIRNQIENNLNFLYPEFSENND